MYKVLIVDDEAIIVEGLIRVVPWEKFGCQVVGSASNAIEGAQLIQTLNPHILFTDIRMPNQDGLSMLAGLRCQYPHMQVTVLTGYRDFSYAQEAIRLGVTRFLLKPSKMNELEEALEVMLQNLAKLPQDQQPREQEKPADHVDVAGSFIVRQAISYIEEHYAQKLSLGEVAQKCYVSQWHLSKLLSRHGGQNFYDLLNGVRIRKAKELLEDPALRINEISERVGYTDTAHFSRVFKKLEKISANEYRNRHTG